MVFIFLAYFTLYNGKMDFYATGINKHFSLAKIC